MIPYLRNIHKRTALQAIVLLLGVTAIVYGVYRGEVKTVLMKAIYICMECIGIG